MSTVNKIELLPHNQTLYDKIIKELVRGERSIFYSEGTGLGKSYIFMRLVQDFFSDKRILYLVPKIAIWSNLTHYEDFNKLENTKIDMVTFASFNTYYREDGLADDYDVVFVDECHHMLSDIRGKNVQIFLADMLEEGKYVFGMTATPNVNGVYVNEECFKVSLYGLDVYEAVEKKLLPKMDLVIGISDYENIPDDLRAKYSIQGTEEVLKRVVEEYPYVIRWLAYFTTKEELEESECELKRIFPAFKILKAYSGLDDNENIIREFENSSTPVILMSVAMFLEGMHLKDVGGVLLYRNVGFLHTYEQIVGRLCRLGSSITPVLVDITGAVLSIKEIVSTRSSKRVSVQRRSYNVRDVFNVSVRDYKMFDLIEMLNYGKSWTEKEDNIIREYYAIEGLNVVERLPGRTKRACSQRASRLRVNDGVGNRKARNSWTEEEDEILRKYYSVEGTEVAMRLPRHTERSCSQRAHRLGIDSSIKRVGAKVPWSQEEDDILRQYYPSESSRVVDRLPGRTGNTCRARANRLGIVTCIDKRVGNGVPWSQEEDAILREYYPIEGSKVMNRLSGRTSIACAHRANKLNIITHIGKWTKKEDTILREYYPTEGIDVVKRLPKRTEEACMHRASVLGLMI